MEDAKRIFQISPKLASISDLVNIIIGHGVKGRPARMVAEEVAEKYFDGRGEEVHTQIEDINFLDLLAVPGIGKDTAMKICAAVELGRRLASNLNKRQAADFSQPGKVARYFMEKMRHEPQEHVIAAYVNVKNRLLGYKEIGIGNVAAAPMDIKEVMKWAIRYKAYGIILLHNHPSGDPEPSKNDIDITRRAAAAAHLIDSQVLDHIIIGDGVFVSLLEREVI